jgi:hypothetical protein
LAGWQQDEWCIIKRSGELSRTSSAEQAEYHERAEQSAMRYIGSEQSSKLNGALSARRAEHRQRTVEPDGVSSASRAGRCQRADHSIVSEPSSKPSGESSALTSRAASQASIGGEPRRALSAERRGEPSIDSGTSSRAVSQMTYLQQAEQQAERNIVSKPSSEPKRNVLASRSGTSSVT